jgi:NADH-quinone oxidoreductase B subunit
MVERLINFSRRKSPWVLHFNTGSCNGCDIEIINALTPRNDLERFGVLLKGSPRHADIMLACGPVTRQVCPRLKRVYEQMAEPKAVIAVGNCAANGGVFKGSPMVMDGIDKVIPVAAYVPGCPPKPEAILYAAVVALNALFGGG